MANTCCLLILTLLYLLVHRSWAGRALGSAAYLEEKELLNSKPDEKKQKTFHKSQTHEIVSLQQQESDLEELQVEYLAANSLVEGMQGGIKTLKDYSKRYLYTLKELVRLLVLQNWRSKISGPAEQEKGNAKFGLGIRKAQKVEMQQEKAHRTLLELENKIAGYFVAVSPYYRSRRDPLLDELMKNAGYTHTPLQTPRINVRSLDKLLEELDGKLYEVRGFQTGMNRRLGPWVKGASDLHSVTQGLLGKIRALHKKTSGLIGEVTEEQGGLIKDAGVMTEKEEGTSSKEEEEEEKELTEEEKLEVHVTAFEVALSSVKQKCEEYRKQFKEYRKEEEVLFEEKREG